jgi:hypothetical protein
VPRVSAGWLGLLLIGGVVVIVSFTLNAGLVLEGGTPTDFAWPIFTAGVGIGVVAATAMLRDERASAPR